MTVRSIPPWKRIRQGAETDYGILRVREDEVEDPRNGSRHPRVFMAVPDWVQVIAVTPDEQVVLVRQFRFGIWAPSLELPGGIVEPGEDPQLAAMRELEEETGFKPVEVKALGWVHPSPALQANKMHYFLAKGCARAHAGKLDASEDIAVELRPRSEIPALIRSGEITHALTVAAFQLEALSLPGTQDVPRSETARAIW